MDKMDSQLLTKAAKTAHESLLQALRDVEALQAQLGKEGTTATPKPKPSPKAKPKPAPSDSSDSEDEAPPAAKPKPSPKAKAKPAPAESSSESESEEDVKPKPKPSPKPSPKAAPKPAAKPKPAAESDSSDEDSSDDDAPAAKPKPKPAAKAKEESSSSSEDELENALKRKAPVAPLAKAPPAKVAKPSPATPSTPASTNTIDEIIFRRCPDTITDGDVVKHFESLGNSAIVNIKWVTSREDGSFRGVGFVRFASPELAAKAAEMGPLTVNGQQCIHHINLPRDQMQQGGGGRGGGGRAAPGTEITLGGCPQSINDDVVKAHYKSLGDDAIVNIKWLERDGAFVGRGFVSFKSAEVAQAAVAMDPPTCPNGQVVRAVEMAGTGGGGRGGDGGRGRGGGGRGFGGGGRGGRGGAPAKPMAGSGTKVAFDD